MFAIETDLGRFEGETERDAKALLRKAQARKRAEDKENERRYAQARYHAAMVAYSIYERKSSGQAFPAGWRAHTINSRHSAVNSSYVDYRTTYTIDCEHGRGSTAPFDPITHSVENGAGYCIAVSIANQDCELFAVGACEGVIAWLPMPGIALDDFRNFT
jgi:hypothetical protein